MKARNEEHALLKELREIIIYSECISAMTEEQVVDLLVNTIKKWDKENNVCICPQ